MPITLTNFSGSLQTLTLPVWPEEVARWAELNIDPAEVFPVEQVWNQAVLSHLPIPATPPRLPPIRVGVLNFPLTGLSRWATFYAVCDGPTLTALKAFNTYPAVKLRITSDAADVAAPGGGWGFHVLPPRPLSGIDGEFYLLTFVDFRYWGWFRTFRLADYATQPALAPTFTNILSGVFSRFSDVVSSVPTFPASASLYDTYTDATANQTGKFFDPVDWHRWAIEGVPLPPLADALAAAIGCRIVLSADNDQGVTRLRLQDAEDAITAFDSFFDTEAAAGRVRTAGGPYDDGFHLRQTPSSVDVVFPSTASRYPYRRNVTLSSLSLTEYTGHVAPVSGTPAASANPGLAATRWAIIPAAGSAPYNETEVDAYAKRLAKSWYLWQARGCDVVYASAVQVPACGIFDVMEVRYDSRRCRLTTRVSSHPQPIGAVRCPPPQPTTVRYLCQVYDHAEEGGGSGVVYKCRVYTDDGRDGNGFALLIAGGIPRWVGYGYIRVANYHNTLGTLTATDIAVDNRLRGESSVSSVSRRLFSNDRVYPASLAGAYTFDDEALPLFEWAHESCAGWWNSVPPAPTLGIETITLFEVTGFTLASPGPDQVSLTLHYTTTAYEFARSGADGDLCGLRIYDTDTSDSATQTVTIPPPPPPP